MSLKSSWKRVRVAFAFAVAAGAFGMASNFIGCGSSNTTTTYATTDPYLYNVYYPSDIAYSTVYWTDDWYYAGLYAVNYPYPVGNGTAGTNGGAGTNGTMITAGTAGTTGAAGITGAAGAAGSTIATGGTGGSTTATGGTGGSTTATTNGVTTAGDTIRALARGDSICPNQITVTPKSAPPPCTGGPTSVRAGVTIVFNGCQTPGGGTISGTVDVTATHTASTTVCDATTIITMSHTTTISNLSYTGPGGAKLVIPSQTDMGMSTYNFGQTPTTVALSLNGQLQVFDAGGGLTADHNFTGTSTFSFGGSTSNYTIDGDLTTTDNRTQNVGTTITVTGLKRATTCCRPVGGTISIVQTSGTAGPGTHTWTFGPTCGAAAVDGTAATLPACI
jgi:hypothetical protein